MIHSNDLILGLLFGSNSRAFESLIACFHALPAGLVQWLHAAAEKTCSASLIFSSSRLKSAFPSKLPLSSTITSKKASEKQHDI